MIRDTDARAILNKERIKYWLGVGATPSGKVSVLIKKYGEAGTHLAAQQAALERLAQSAAARGPAGRAEGPQRKEDRGRRHLRPTLRRRRNSRPGRRRGRKRITMRFDVSDPLPEIFQGYLGQSLLNKAIQAGLVDVRCTISAIGRKENTIPSTIALSGADPEW